MTLSRMAQYNAPHKQLLHPPASRQHMVGLEGRAAGARSGQVIRSEHNWRSVTCVRAEIIEIEVREYLYETVFVHGASKEYLRQ